MRIITGSARGVRLLTLEGGATRPTAERTKEALFSIIQFDIEGRKVLDLFGGSGQLALEALSRGAAEAVICDSSREAAEIIRKNAEKTRLAEKCKIYVCKSEKLLRSFIGERFDLIFLDPPYALTLIPDTLKGLLEHHLLKPTSLIICESADADDVFKENSELSEMFYVKRSSRYGAAFVTILQPKEDTL